MTGIIIAALAVVALVGIPLGILMGRNMSRRAPAGTAPISPRLRNHQWFWPSVLGTAALIAITASAVIFYGPIALVFIATLSVAGYGAWNGGGKGAIIFTWMVGGILALVALLLTLGYVVLGPEGASKAYVGLQKKANDIVENGIGGEATEPKNEQIKLVNIGAAWHEEKVPLGKRVCYDPFDKLSFREDTNEAVHYTKSKDSKPIGVHIFHVRYGQPCKKT